MIAEGCSELAAYARVRLVRRKHLLVFFRLSKVILSLRLLILNEALML